jgi:hypothetical protein
VNTLTEEYVETRTSDTPGDASHIVMVPAGEKDQTAQAYVLRARIEGFPVAALCGWTWVPQKDPKPLPVCSTCLHIYQTQGSDLDKRGELPDA